MMRPKKRFCKTRHYIFSIARIDSLNRWLAGWLHIPFPIFFVLASVIIINIIINLVANFDLNAR